MWECRFRCCPQRYVAGSGRRPTPLDARRVPPPSWARLPLKVATWVCDALKTKISREGDKNERNPTAHCNSEKKQTVDEV